MYRVIYRFMAGATVCLANTYNASARYSKKEQGYKKFGG